MSTYYQIIDSKNNVISMRHTLEKIFAQLYSKINDLLDDKKNIEQLKSVIRLVSIESVYLNVMTTRYRIEYNDGIVIRSGFCIIKISSLFPQFAALEKMLLGPAHKSATTITEPTPVKTVQQTLAPQSVPKVHPKKNPYKHQPEKSISKPVEEPPKPQMTEEDELFEQEKEKRRNAVIERNKIAEKYNVFENDKKSFVQIDKDINSGLLRPDDIHPCFVAKHVVFSVMRDRGDITFENNNALEEEYVQFADLLDSLEYEDEETGKSSTAFHIPHNYLFLSDFDKEECAKKNGMTRRELEAYIQKISSGSVDDIFN